MVQKALTLRFQGTESIVDMFFLLEDVLDAIEFGI